MKVRANRKPERNADLFARWRQGLTLAELAQIFHISRPNVSHLVRQEAWRLGLDYKVLKDELNRKARQSRPLYVEPDDQVLSGPVFCTQAEFTTWKGFMWK